MIGFLLAVTGALLLLLSLAGVAFNLYMALDDRTRERGVFFAIWSITAVAASIGVLMRDWVTFAVGAFCFVVAGAALALDQLGSRRPDRGRKTGSKESTRGLPYRRTKRWLSDKIRDYRKIGS